MGPVGAQSRSFGVERHALVFGRGHRPYGDVSEACGLLWLGGVSQMRVCKGIHSVGLFFFLLWRWCPCSFRPRGQTSSPLSLPPQSLLRFSTWRTMPCSLRPCSGPPALPPCLGRSAIAGAVVCRAPGLWQVADCRAAAHRKTPGAQLSDGTRCCRGAGARTRGGGGGSRGAQDAPESGRRHRMCAHSPQPHEARDGQQLSTARETRCGPRGTGQRRQPPLPLPLATSSCTASGYTMSCVPLPPCFTRC